MSKKMKILIAVVSAVVLIGVIGTVTVMAQTPTPTPTPTPTAKPPVRPNINARVAQILGITEAQLNDAIKQAKTALATPTAPATPATPSTPTKPVRPTPIKTADLYAKVAQILNNPNITADKIAAAYQQAQKEARDQAINSALDNAVKNNKITQDEANQIKQWWQNRPPSLDKLGIPFGMEQFKQNIQGQMKNFENRFHKFQQQFKNFEGRMKGFMKPQPQT